MGGLISGIIIFGIWIYLWITQSRENKAQIRYYEDKLQEATIKGNDEMADIYRQALVLRKSR